MIDSIDATRSAAGIPVLSRSISESTMLMAPAMAPYSPEWEKKRLAR
ncbi:MAG: hypothetical protein J0H80_08405 [Rhizobiales bacterium]|nr:hypothetical protein [Hyphomicrobiales bacterium]